MTDYSKDIERYLNGEMTSAERHALEKKSLSDPFLAEALEGAEQLTAADFDQDIKALHKAIDLKVKQHGKNNQVIFWSLRLAAGLLVLAVATYLIINFSDQLKPAPATSYAKPTQEMEEIAPAPDTNTISLPKDQLALAEEKDAEKREITDKQKPAKAKNSVPIIEDEKQATPVQDVIQEETKAEALKAEAASPIVTSTAEIQEKKTEIIVASEAGKEAESTTPKPTQDTSTRGRAKRSVADARSNAQLPPASAISGVVTSAEDGSPLPGVNVVLKGTTLGTITDAEGKFTLDGATLASTLVYSFIGLQTKEVTVTDTNPLNVSLNVDVAQLSEVVVTGYGYSDRNESTPTVDLAHPEIGNRAYRKYLEENLIYPQRAIDNKTEGRVTVEFFVEANGSLSDFIVTKGIGNGCDEELIRLIKEGPKWIPTKKDDQPIRDKARVRLNFQIPGK
jgi:TonB family protein